MKLLLALLLLLPLTAAQAMTKQECIQAGYGCHWSKGTGGKINGWFYTTGKKQAAGKPSKPDARAEPTRSSTAMSAAADAAALAFGGTDHQSSTRGSKREHAKEVMPHRPASQSAQHDSRPRSAFLPVGAAIFPLPVPESLTPQRRISEAWEGWR